METKLQNNVNHLENEFNEQISLFLDKIIDLTNKTSQEYLAQNLSEAEVKLLFLMEKINLFLEITGNLTHVFKSSNKLEPEIDKKLYEIQIHLLSVIKAIQQANQKSDHIVLHDLIEYELIDNLKQWKIMILPLLKTLK